MNIYSQIGLVTLIGLIAKNGILIVEFANHMQREGHSKLEAVRSAALTRTIFTLFIVPSLYMLMAKDQKKHA
jgi:multidrug efflux pump subunit AcrB